jgi:hypothetical protein
MHHDSTTSSSSQVRPTYKLDLELLDNIPDLLKEKDHWVCWRYELSTKGKWTKVPYQAQRPSSKASTTDPQTWNPYETAVRTYRKGGFDGIGFCFAHEGGLVGFDLDGVITGGEIDPWAETIFANTYREISPSGCGVKGFFWGTLPGPGFKRSGVGPGGQFGLEMYDAGRFFTVTGDILEDCREILVVDPQALDVIYEQYRTKPHETNGDTPHGAPLASDEELIKIARWLPPCSGFPGGTWFSQLFDHGKFTRGTWSDADWSLCCMLAWLGNRDPEFVDRVFRRSQLMRPKWDESRGKTTYGTRTVAKAIACTAEVYAPRNEGGDSSYSSFNSSTPYKIDDSAPVSVEAPAWPAPPHECVYFGVMGDFVREIEPHTESDPFGLLVQGLIMAGNLIGRSPYFVVEATKHHANENAILVGQTSQGRKGTAGDWVKGLFSKIDPDWIQGRIKGGLSSGEGVISAVRDAVWEDQPIKEKGIIKDYQKVMVDAGEEDKRLLVLETEFGGVLRVLDREGNKLSALLRQAWDHGNLVTLTKTPFVATDAHVSIIGHITAQELLALLSHVDAANGFANRFLWIAVKRSKILPFGGSEVNLGAIKEELACRIATAQTVRQVTLTGTAKALWGLEYERLTSERPGLLGFVTSRGAPHVLRLAMIYALLDGKDQIDGVHLAPAVALWDASSRCAAHIFGDSLGDHDADKILAALKQAKKGLTKKEISVQVFQRNVKADRLDAALSLLLRFHLIAQESVSTGGRPAMRFRVV